MVSETQTPRYFPYVGAPGWLTKLHQACVRSMPQRMETDWLMAPDRLGLSQANARQLLSFMQRVGWVESDGSLSEDGKKLRLVGESWQEAMRETAQRFYADLLQRIESATEFRLQDLEQFLADATNMGQSGRQQMISVFRWFLREANLTDLEQKVWSGTGTASERAGEARRERPKPPGAKSREPTTAKAKPAARKRAPTDQDSAPGDPRLSAIASVLKISIDGTWEEERMKAAFRMLDRLLKGEPING
jgi:hypothetical protein